VGDRGSHPDLQEVSPILLKLLQEAGDEYGPLGVARVAAQLTDVEVLLQALGYDPLPEDDEVSIRVSALELAVKSHPPIAGAPHDTCFTKRASVFAHFLRTGESAPAEAHVPEPGDPYEPPVIESM